MGLPTQEDNLIGYQKANVIDKVELLRNKSLFLIHGTFDNIALYQNSMMLARALQLKKIQFRQQVKKIYHLDFRHRNLFYLVFTT